MFLMNRVKCICDSKKSTVKLFLKKYSKPDSITCFVKKRFQKFLSSISRKQQARVLQQILSEGKISVFKDSVHKKNNRGLG